MTRVFTRFWRGSSRGGTGPRACTSSRASSRRTAARSRVGRAPGGGAEFRFTLPAGAPAFSA